MNSPGSPHSIVVGGGIVGLACAHYLSEAGHRVTVLDRGGIGRACSLRNCGFICPSHVLPLAEPGVPRAAFLSMLTGQGALRVRPRLDPKLLSWFWKFWRRCNESHRLEGGRAIQPLLKSSEALYEELLGEGGLACEYHREGLLFVYRNRRALEAFEPVNELLTTQFSEPARLLDGAELGELEPALRPGLAGGWYYETDAHLRPEKLIDSWSRELTARGVTLVENVEFRALVEENGRVSGVRTGSETLEADHVVIATGAWTPRLAEALGIELPIQPGKGYSLIAPRPPRSPRIPMIFPEHRVAVTPFEEGLRLGSIMEFAGYDESVRPEMLDLLTDGASHYLADPVEGPFTDAWSGWRPMTPDSVPYIGPLPGRTGVILATGHNMLGLSMAPATGRLVAELVTGAPPHLDPTPYRADRT